MSALIKPASQGKARAGGMFGSENSCITSDASATDSSEAAKAGKAFADTLKDKISTKADDRRDKPEQDSDEVPVDAVANSALSAVASETQPQVQNITFSNPVVAEATAQTIEQLQSQLTSESGKQTSIPQTPAAAAISTATVPATTKPDEAKTESFLQIVSENAVEPAMILPEIPEITDGTIAAISSEENAQVLKDASQAENPALPITKSPAVPQNTIPAQDLAAEPAINAEKAVFDTENTVESSKPANPQASNMVNSVVEQPVQSAPKLVSPAATAYTQENQFVQQEVITNKTKSQTSDGTNTVEPVAESDIDIAVDALPQEQSAGKNTQPQTQNQTTLNTDSNFGSEVSAQAIANNPQQTAGKEFSVAALNTTPSDIHNTNFGSSVREQVSNFIQSSYQPGGQQQISFRLNPANLGSVTVNFQENAEGITGTLHVNQTQTKDEIQRAIPEMIRNLGEAGIHIKKLEVVLTNQQSYDNAKDQSFNASQNGNPSQQNQPESGQTSGGTNQNQWKTNIANSGKFDQQQGYHTDKSIDMLA
jgi:flagellar hook-length control protein FliK